LRAFTAFDALAESYPLMDVRDTLREGKSEQAMYYPGDTHWTEAGVIRAINQMREPLGLDQRELICRPYYSDRPKDLRRMMALPIERQSEGAYHYELATPLGLSRQIYTPKSPIPHPQPNIDAVVFENPESTGPHVVLLHDSFGESLREKLALRCRRLVCLPTSYWPDAILRDERPDIVLMEIAERKILLPVTIHR